MLESNSKSVTSLGYLACCLFLKNCGPLAANLLKTKLFDTTFVITHILLVVGLLW